MFGPTSAVHCPWHVLAPREVTIRPKLGKLLVAIPFPEPMQRSSMHTVKDCLHKCSGLESEAGRCLSIDCVVRDLLVFVHRGRRRTRGRSCGLQLPKVLYPEETLLHHIIPIIVEIIIYIMLISEHEAFQ